VIADCTLSLEERSALEHFNVHHAPDNQGHFVVSLAKRDLKTKLGESRSQALCRFLSFEKFTHSKGIFLDVTGVIQD